MGGWASDGLVLARTCVWSTLDFIYESDMVFNIHGDAKWANGAFAGYWDLQSVASHEFGHALGLGHTENGASRQTAAAVMHPIVYQQDTRNRSLSRGDIDGATSLYPRLFGFEIVAATIQNPAGSGARLEPNRTYQATVDVINRGYRPWRVGDSSGLLVSTHPLARCSSYAGGDWRSCSEPSVLDADLTDGGGGPENTAAIVAQGEQGRFEFQIPVTWAREGTVSFEQFRVRGIPVSDPGTFTLPVDVGTIAAVAVGQSGPGILLQNVVLRGMPAVASVTIRNEGTAPWILDGRLSLVTDPAGRCSVYRGSDWSSCTVASGVDRPQGIVQAGETATFSFNFASSLYLSPDARAANERFDVEYAGRPTPRLNAKTQFRYEMW